MKTALIIVVAVLLMPCSLAYGNDRQAREEIKVMSFNVWADGRNDKKEGMMTVKVIKDSGADIVGLQESTPEFTMKLAEELGWESAHFGSGHAVLSRYSILQRHQRGATVRLESGSKAHVFNTHLPASPYQPYQLLDIPYGNAPFIDTEKQAIDAAKKARGDQLMAFLKGIEVVLPTKEPIFVTGDFNEPSHLDWTKDAAKAGLHPIKASYPTSRVMADARFVDAYREVFKDEVEYPGYTWTPITAIDDPKDKHDRIDFVYYRGKRVKPVKAEVVGEKKKYADIVVDPYPSDHRAVVVTFEIQSK